MGHDKGRSCCSFRNEAVCLTAGCGFAHLHHSSRTGRLALRLSWAFWYLACVCSTLAGWSSWSSPAEAADKDLFVRPGDQYTVVFASADVGKSVFVEGGFKRTLVGPLDRTGFVAMETNGYGLTREVVRGAGVTVPALRVTTQAATLLGYQWNGNGVFLAAYAGPEFRHEQLAVDWGVRRVSEPRIGVRGQAELWANPSADTLVTATVVAGSSRASAYGRSSAGYRVAGQVYVGPEVAGYATSTYREMRVGVHATGFELGVLQGRVSAGYMLTDDGRHGSPYVGLTGWIRM